MSEQKRKEQELIESIFELHRSIISIFFKSFEDIYILQDGLNFTHMKAAMILRFEGKMPMSDLSAKLVLEKGSFTPVAARLIERGLVKKERSVEDKRVYMLGLTAEGEKLTGRFKDEHWKYMTNVLNKLTAEERADYLEQLSNLNKYNKLITESGI